MSPSTAREWLDLVLDPGWTPLFEDVVFGDPLRFPGYAEQLEAARAKTGCTESVLVAEGVVERRRVIAISFEFGFLGGSMGVAAGERICRAFERAAQEKIPVIALTASGGARLQEGMLALSQMPATLTARAKLAEAHQPLICYLRNPTTGGVYASFASSADVLWAEPGATIGFAGPRVAETVTGERLPEDSHTAESAYGACRIDDLVSPGELRERVGALVAVSGWFHVEVIARTSRESSGPATADAWREVELARHRDRPTGTDVAPVKTWLRRAGLDPTVSVGFVETGPRAIVIAQNRKAGHGRTGVEGYRAARRGIELAVRLQLPIVTLIDSPGADPAAASEGGGIASEISATFEALLSASVPTIAVVVGEGGSGGALALAACDVVMIMEHAIFSVIAPEGAAAILRRKDVDAAARDLHLTSRDLIEFGLADVLIPEPGDGAHTDPESAIGVVREAVNNALPGMLQSPAPSARRLDRWRVWR
jgi:acetyl-CoA carboxylase carboxyl transferase beta subunit